MMNMSMVHPQPRVYVGVDTYRIVTNWVSWVLTYAEDLGCDLGGFSVLRQLFCSVSCVYPERQNYPEGLGLEPPASLWWLPLR